MAKIYESITDLIGKTPIVKAKNYRKAQNLDANLLLKIESFNPGGSVKDRIALAMITDLEEKGLINKDTVLVEPTSGNTGIGLSLVAAARGYKVIIVMPDTMSVERRLLSAAYGSQIILTEGSKGMPGAIAKAEEIKKENPNAFIPQQFENPANPKAHFESTGVEIWEDTDGNVDVFVAGIGTGGTISGVGKYLKSKNPNVKIIAVEPTDSPILSKGEKGPHKIQGIGAGFIPETLDTSVYDEIITVSNEDAFSTARSIAKTDGVFVGISSGAALFAATEVAKRPEFAGKNIVALMPDVGERYLSTQLFKLD